MRREAAGGAPRIATRSSRRCWAGAARHLSGRRRLPDPRGESQPRGGVRRHPRRHRQRFRRGDPLPVAASRTPTRWCASSGTRCETGEPYFTPERSEQRADRGVTEYYEWQISRIPLPDGRFGVVCYFRDISAHVLRAQRSWRPRTSRRTSSWRCWRTSCAIHWLRSAIPVRCWPARCRSSSRAGGGGEHRAPGRPSGATGR